MLGEQLPDERGHCWKSILYSVDFTPDQFPVLCDQSISAGTVSAGQVAASQKASPYLDFPNGRSMCESSSHRPRETTASKVRSGIWDDFDCAHLRCFEAVTGSSEIRVRQWTFDTLISQSVKLSWDSEPRMSMCKPSMLCCASDLFSQLRWSWSAPAVSTFYSEFSRDGGT